ncbi:MAG: hypothetical protein HKO09_09020, partial [Croceitalea sp.]|nr:hypothetical protein [Croceitalea sp.]
MNNFASKCIKHSCLIIIFLFTVVMSAQVKKAFTPRYSETINGDVTIIANNMLSEDPILPFIIDEDNQDDDRVFVDIDTDPSTFNSSSANYTNPELSIGCLQYNRAYLYWAASDKEAGGATINDDTWNFNQVKLMLPGSSSYTTLTADEVLYRGRDEHFENDPYVCVKDITSQVLALTDPYGKYQVANVKAARGGLNPHGGGNFGVAGGWQIVFVYQATEMPLRDVTIFDGYAHVDNNETTDFSVDGFISIPTGPVMADIVLGSIEGDRVLNGDSFQILKPDGNWQKLSTINRGEDNFFNSKITVNNLDFIDRNPASTNTLGFDASVFELSNSGNTLIANNQTGTSLRATSGSESYGVYLVGFAIDVYEPSLGSLDLLTYPANTTYNPGDVATLSVSIENTGNDNIKDLEITMVLPPEVDFNAIQPLPPGVTFSFNSGTRELKFFVADGFVDTDDPEFNVNFDLKVKEQCYFLEGACEANFSIQASATFTGEINTDTQTAESSGTMDECGFGNHDPTVITINQPDQVNWSSTGNDLDRTVSCDDSAALATAQSLEPLPEFCNFTLNKVVGDFVPDAACPSQGTYTNTFTFTDGCGRVSDTYTQVITVEDSSAPVFDQTLPADSIVSCDAVPSADTLTASDNCDASVTVNFSETFAGQGDSCPSEYNITRTWTVSDCAGNSTTHVQNITVEDNSAPNFVEVLPSDTVAAYDNIPTAETLTANDNCDLAASVNFVESYIGDNTSTTYTIVRTWTASDCAGNTISHSQNIFVSENGDPIGLSIDDITINENVGNAVLTITHIGNVSGGFTVNHATVDSSAEQPADYVQNTDNTSFAGLQGETQTITIAINDDSVIELDESLLVNLSPGTNTPTINDNSGQITILDNDSNPALGISVADFTVDEGVGSTTFDVSLNVEVQDGFTVDYTITDGSATAGNDYTVSFATGTLTFIGNNSEIQTVTINIVDDALLEGPEDLDITLSNISNPLVAMVDDSATGNINDNEAPAAGDGISVADFTVSEDA